MGQIIENNLIIEIDKVKPNDYNPKPDYKESEELKLEFEKIKDSLKVHGQIDPVLVREIDDGYEIVNGYHRWTAMKELGFEKIEIKNLGKILREDAIKKALSTEELRIPLDVIEVNKLIKEIKESEAGLEGLPYLEQEIQDKIDLLEFDWNQFDTEEDIEKENLNILKFAVSEKQKEIILKALKKVMEEEKVKESSALEFICNNFLVK